MCKSANKSRISEFMVQSIFTCLPVVGCDLLTVIGEKLSLE